MDLPPPTKFEKPEQENVVSFNKVKEDLEAARASRGADYEYDPHFPKTPDTIAPNIIKYGESDNFIAKFTYASSEIKVDIRKKVVVIIDKTSGTSNESVKSNEFKFSYYKTTNPELEVLDSNGKKIFVFNLKTGEVTQFINGEAKKYIPEKPLENKPESAFTGPLSSNIRIVSGDPLGDIEQRFELNIKFKGYSIRFVKGQFLFLSDYANANDEKGPEIKPYSKPEVQIRGNTMIITFDNLDRLEINLENGSGVLYTGDNTLNLLNPQK